jgi:hypothetical protein
MQTIIPYSWIFFSSSSPTTTNIFANYTSYVDAINNSEQFLPASTYGICWMTGKMVVVAAVTTMSKLMKRIM